MRYSVATCVPNTFKDSGFTLQQVYYDPPRRTELFIGTRPSRGWRPSLRMHTRSPASNLARTSTSSSTNASNSLCSTRRASSASVLTSASAVSSTNQGVNCTRRSLSVGNPGVANLDGTGFNDNLSTFNYFRERATGDQLIHGLHPISCREHLLTFRMCVWTIKGKAEELRLTQKVASAVLKSLPVSTPDVVQKTPQSLSSFQASALFCQSVKCSHPLLDAVQASRLLGGGNVTGA
ncbi:hypothetical protein CVT25_007335 [Psilocybe cyanescens]|uniref:Chitin synthase N-terminal domain-containing protein n=1 Tax=Psilocybe cyanescens TaxID=93625 RepID=A0A409XJC8_PSICY|nr:hypothetical protein CVT25_007335 [Psilocybe cyanescens]